MIILDSSTKLQIIFAGAKATNDCKVTVSYGEETATTKTFGNQIATTNGVTAVDILAAPASSTWRLVKSIVIENADTAAVTLTIRTNIAAALATCFKAILAVGDTLIYEDGQGWSVMNSKGEIKQNFAALSYRLKNIVILTSGTLYTMSSGLNAIEIELIGAGGGGGGASGTASNAGSAGGGASGGYLRKFIASPPAGVMTIAIGSGGGGGTGNNMGTANNGTTGGDTTLTCNSVTYTAKGGLGGVAMLAGTTKLTALGGAGQLPTNGDINITGTPGDVGVRMSGTISVSGNGGALDFFGGSQGGSNGTSMSPSAPNYGLGGAGANNLNGFGSNGSGGGNGIIIIREYV